MNIITTEQGKNMFYNEGACSHEGNPGIYKHNCAHCWKQGRTYSHPETKCHYKSVHKQQDKQQK